MKFLTEILAKAGITSNYFKLDTSATPPIEAGKVVWNAADGTFDMGLLNNVTLQAGQELHFYGKAVGAISNGQAVMFAGAQGDHALMTLADAATINANPEYFIGIATQDFANNQFGYVTVLGKVRGLNTSAYTAGDLLYYNSTSATDGLLTATMPSAPNAKILVAAVLRVHANEGILLVRPHTMPKISDIQDVSISSLANNNFFVYDSATSVWKNKTIAAALGYTPANDSNVVKLTGDQTVAGAKTFTSVINASTLSINGGTLVGNNIVSMRSNPTGGQFRIEKSDGSLSAYPFYIGVDGTALAYYYNAAGALKVLLHTDNTSYFGNSLSIGYSTYATTSYMLDVNGTGRFISSVNVQNFLTVSSASTLVAPSSGKSIEMVYRTDGANDYAFIQTYDRTNSVFKQLRITGSTLILNEGGGNVGFGLTNPQSQIHLNGTITFSESGYDTVRLHTITHSHSNGSNVNNWLSFNVSNGSGVTNTALRLNGAGQLRLNSYTASSSFSGTAAGYLAFDSSGNVITVAGVASTVTAGFSLTTQGAANNTPSTPSVNAGVYAGVYAFIDLATQNENGGWIDFSKGDGSDFAGRIRYYANPERFGFHTAGGAEKITFDASGNIALVSGNILLGGGSSSSQSTLASGLTAIRFPNQYSSGYTDAGVKLYIFNSGTTIQGFTAGPAYDLQYHSSGSDSGRHAFYVANSEIIRFSKTIVGVSGILQMSTSGTSYISMGRFPNSVSNSGEAWLGRASDRSTGSMTVQLGGSSNASFFEVVDYGWTTVTLKVGMNDFSYKGNAVIHAGNIGSYTAGSSQQVTINYNNDSNSTYQLLWGSGNSVYGTSQVYVNPSSDVIYARGGYISPSNPWGTSDSAFFPNGITTAGSRNWIYGATYIGNAPGNGQGVDIGASGNAYFRSNVGTSSHGSSARFLEIQSGAGNFIPYSFESEYGNHSWGTVMRIRINQSGADRPSIQFSSASNDNRWNVGYCYNDDNFRVTQNMAYRNDNSTTDGWGTERFRINTDGNTYAAIGGTLYANGNTVWHAGNAPRAANSNLMYYAGFTLDANTMPSNSTGFTYSVNAPYTGPIAKFSEDGYPLQLNATYGGGGTNIAYRTRNGDAGTWNSWYRLYSDTYRPYADNAGNANSISNAVGTGFTWTGVQSFLTNNGGSAVNNSNSAILQVYSTGNNSAFMSFHKAGHYAINMGLDGDNVFRIGGWSAGPNRLQLDMSGNLTVAGNMNATYFYGSGSIRCGDMWGGAGLYHPNGNMVFGTENYSWIFSSQANTRVTITPGGAINASGNITSTGGNLRSNNWVYSEGNSGWYNDTYGQGLRQVKGNVSYGQVIVYGENYNGWSGYNTNNSTITAFMQNSSGTHGFYQENNAGWTLFWNAGYACWGLGTDATDPAYSLHITKYGGSNTGWIIWSDRRIKENIKTIDGALDKILSLRGVYYNKIDDPNKERQVGYIAQEVLEVVPELVVYSEELDIYNMNYAPMVSMLTEATKEHYAKTLAQQTEIDALKEQVQTLLNHINNGV